MLVFAKGRRFENSPTEPVVVTQASGIPRRYYRDLLSVETVATLNAGFCDYHLKNCPPHKQILEECTKVRHLLDIVSLMYSD